MNQNIISLFKQRKFEELALIYSPDEIVRSLSFQDCLRLSYQLLYNDKWDEGLQVFSVKLLNKIRSHYSKAWNESWEYDALLGTACYITLNYDERYKFYKKALEKTSTPPAGLLIEFARSCISPGLPPLSYDDAIKLVMKALEKESYADGIGLLSHIYSLKNDKKNEEFWTNKLKSIDQNFISPSIDPKFLQDEYIKNQRVNPA